MWTKCGVTLYFTASEATISQFLFLSIYADDDDFHKHGVVSVVHKVQMAVEKLNGLDAQSN